MISGIYKFAKLDMQHIRTGLKLVILTFWLLSVIIYADVHTTEPCQI